MSAVAEGITYSVAIDEVHVWTYALDASPAEFERWPAVLDPAERARAAAFRFERDQIRFVVAHGILRMLLGRYLSSAPESLGFTFGAQGKPRLAVGFAAASDLRFNLSHSHGLAMLAVTLGREVGVDLEQMREDVDCEGIVASHFSPAEQAAWSALSARVRRTAFFHGWVRKEAYVKALGRGLSHEPRSYTVDIAPDGPGALLDDQAAPGGVPAWTVCALAAPAGYAAALAHAGPPRRLRLNSLRGQGVKFPE